MPDEAAYQAAMEIFNLLSSLGSEDIVLALISGKCHKHKQYRMKLYIPLKDCHYSKTFKTFFTTHE